MGIVAYCPNDHRVKVKDNLAGKKGICPTCGARFRIPFESQPDRKHVAIDDTGPPEELVAIDHAAAVSAPVSHQEPPPLAPSAPVTPPPLPAAITNVRSATGLPVAEIISLDSNLAESLPRVLPLASK